MLRSVTVPYRPWQRNSEGVTVTEPVKSTGADAAADRLRSAATALQQRTQQMAGAAASGELKIDEADGTALLRGLVDQLDRIDEWIERGKRLAAPLPFGAQWLGDAMSSKFSARADGADAALVPVLQQYRDCVADAARAIQTTLRDYGHTEEHNADLFRRLERSVGA